MTEDTVARPRVRPGFRRAAIAIFVLLLPVAAHALWDYLESRRLSNAVEAIRQRGERVYLGTSFYGRPITPEQKQASRYYGAAAHLVREAYGKALATAARDIESLSGTCHLPRSGTIRDSIRSSRLRNSMRPRWTCSIGRHDWTRVGSTMVTTQSTDFRTGLWPTSTRFG